jgi:hypothetical protein
MEFGLRFLKANENLQTLIGNNQDSGPISGVPIKKVEK